MRRRRQGLQTWNLQPFHWPLILVFVSSQDWTSASTEFKRDWWCWSPNVRAIRGEDAWACPSKLGLGSPCAGTAGHANLCISGNLRSNPRIDLILFTDKFVEILWIYLVQYGNVIPIYANSITPGRIPFMLSVSSFSCESHTTSHWSIKLIKPDDRKWIFSVLVSRQFYIVKGLCRR